MGFHLGSDRYAFASRYFSHSRVLMRPSLFKKKARSKGLQFFLCWLILFSGMNNVIANGARTYFRTPDSTMILFFLCLFFDSVFCCLVFKSFVLSVSSSYFPRSVFITISCHDTSVWHYLIDYCSQPKFIHLVSNCFSTFVGAW